MTDAEIKLNAADLESLFGAAFFLMEQPLGRKGLIDSSDSSTTVTTEPGMSTSNTGPSIQWKPKPSSKLLFVIHQAEIRDKSLSELLKKIVSSIGIPFDSAGFGIITGEVSEESFKSMPNSLAVVFDRSLSFGANNPHIAEYGEVFFAHRLAELEVEKEYKVELWKYLKQIQSRVV